MVSRPSQTSSTQHTHTHTHQTNKPGAYIDVNVTKEQRTRRTQTTKRKKMKRRRRLLACTGILIVFENNTMLAANRSPLSTKEDFHSNFKSCSLARRSGNKKKHHRSLSLSLSLFLSFWRSHQIERFNAERRTKERRDMKPGRKIQC